MTDKLVGYRCVKCGHRGFPRHSRCPKCRGTGFEDVELRTGKLLSYTIVHATAKGVETPLVLGLVEFEEGVRILGRLVGGPLHPGTVIRPVPRTLRTKDDRSYTGFGFELAVAS